jgi:hypothetical protein
LQVRESEAWIASVRAALGAGADGTAVQSMKHSLLDEIGNRMR